METDTSRRKKFGFKHDTNTKHRYWRALVIEYIATTLFVFCACGSVVAQQVYAIPTSSANLMAGLVQGFSIAALVYTAGPSSGGHINPAVTLGLMVSGDMYLMDGLGYIVFQSAGGITGAALLSGVLPGHVEGMLGTTTLSNGTSRFQGYVFETIVTFLLLFTIFGSSVDKKGFIGTLAPIPIGFSVAAGVTIAYGFTGGSLNPARTFGPAVISHTWNSNYIYWFGPFTGAILAGLVYRFILKKERNREIVQEELRQQQQPQELNNSMEQGHANLGPSSN